MNLVILQGNLTRDPEMRYTPSGTAVTSFGLATNNGKDKPADFHNIIVWGQKDGLKGGQAEACANMLQKGSKVLVKGRLTYNKWEDQEGNPRTRTEVVADSFFGVEFLSNLRQREEREEPEVRDVDPDDIPF